MIKTLTPFYLDIPLVNPDTLVVCNSFTLKIYVWDGIKTSVPSTADYEQTIINASGSNGSQKINIARIVNDFIEFNCVQSTVTSLEDGNNQVWVKTAIFYDDEPTLQKFPNTSLAIKGYGYFLEGENPQPPTNKIMLEGDEFKINRNGFFVLPIVMEETTPPTPTLVIDNIVHDTGDQYILSFTTNIGFDEILYQYSITTLNIWTLGSETGTASPFNITLPTTPGTYDVQIFTYDVLTNTNIYSNIFTIVIP